MLRALRELFQLRRPAPPSGCRTRCRLIRLVLPFFLFAFSVLPAFAAESTPDVSCRIVWSRSSGAEENGSAEPARQVCTECVAEIGSDPHSPESEHFPGIAALRSRHAGMRGKNQLQNGSFYRETLLRNCHSPFPLFSRTGVVSSVFRRNGIFRAVSSTASFCPAFLRTVLPVRAGPPARC